MSKYFTDSNQLPFTLLEKQCEALLTVVKEPKDGFSSDGLVHKSTATLKFEPSRPASLFMQPFFIHACICFINSNQSLLILLILCWALRIW